MEKRVELVYIRRCVDGTAREFGDDFKVVSLTRDQANAFLELAEAANGVADTPVNGNGAFARLRAALARFDFGGVAAKQEP